MSIFIGRGEEMDWALDVLLGMVGVDPGADAGENGVVWDLSGMHGIGKSVLLEKLRRSAEGQDVLVIEEKMGEYAENILRAGDCGVDASAEALRSAFSRSCKVMRHVAKERGNEAEFTVFEQVRKRELANVGQFDLDNDVRAVQRPAARLDGDSVRSQLKDFQRKVRSRPSSRRGPICAGVRCS